MNIFFTVKSYWPAKGGVQTVTKYLAEGLADCGYNVFVITERENNLEYEFVNGVSVVRFNHKAFAKINTGDKKGFQKYILDNVKAEDVIISVCAQSFNSEWFFPIVDKVKAKKIMFMHGMRNNHVDLTKVYSLKSFLKESILVFYWNSYFRRYWKCINKFSSAIHLYENDSSYSYFVNHGFKNNYVIENCCEEAFFSSNIDLCTPQKYGINRRYFILVANYDDNKNQEFALSAYLLSKLSDIDIVFVGSKTNRYYYKLLNDIENVENNERIHILASVCRKDTIQLIKNSFCCLLSSRSEYFPVSIIEGLASGIPFISTPVGVVTKMLGGKTAFSLADYAYWMRYLAEHQDYYDKLKVEAKTFALNQFVIREKISQLEKIILE